jgi:hypothetical protein
MTDELDPLLFCGDTLARFQEDYRYPVRRISSAHIEQLHTPSLTTSPTMPVLSPLHRLSLMKQITGGPTADK